MKRSLCLLLGKNPEIDGSNVLKLTVPTSNFKALDAFTMNRFQNSDDVREYFKDQIGLFLALKNPNNRGAIVIVEFPTKEDEIPRKVRVLYMGIVQRVQDILNNDVFLRYLVENDETKGPLKLFSGYETDVILIRNGQDYTKKERKIILNKWKDTTLKSSYFGTDRLRKVLKLYEKWCHENHIKMISHKPTLKQKVLALTKKEEDRIKLK